MCSTPAMPAVIAEQREDEDGQAVDRDAGAHRRLTVAADGVGVPAELRLVQDEDGDGDGDGGHDAPAKAARGPCCRSASSVTSGLKRTASPPPSPCVQ